MASDFEDMKTSDLIYLLAQNATRGGECPGVVEELDRRIPVLPKWARHNKDCGCMGCKYLGL